MARKRTRDKFPDGVTYNQVMKASLILIANSEIALDQLETIKGINSNFYRQEVKGALNNAIRVLQPYVEEFVNFHDNPDEEAEKGYYQVTNMIETFTEILAETSGEKLGVLDTLLNSFKDGQFKTVSEEEFDVLPSKESESGGRTSNDSEAGTE